MCLFQLKLIQNLHYVYNTINLHLIASATNTTAIYEPIQASDILLRENEQTWH